MRPKPAGNAGRPSGSAASHGTALTAETLRLFSSPATYGDIRARLCEIVVRDAQSAEGPRVPRCWKEFRMDDVRENLQTVYHPRSRSREIRRAVGRKHLIISNRGKLFRSRQRGQNPAFRGRAVDAEAAARE